ncbi:protein virilizer homolog isoform X1 [Stegostoma tigrinum]|uniref:protein virilizer homolog isoform X1 n=1 Tax=Stegostoma tigrinum TaxID=3053191 RepID=UPI00202B51DB|nr:protein virilizer homolog isoform X1 [Stegostoma tigrinum]
MADTAAELLFLDTFKHSNSEQNTHVDVVRFPCVVYVNEVRVIPPGVKAHNSLPDSRAYGETSPHAFQLDLFFNNVSKPSSPVFDRLGSLDYDESASIIFRPNNKVNTDGIVLRGWYNCLTVAIYGTVDRVISHDRDSPPPPPPPPPPPQQQQQQQQQQQLQPQQLQLQQQPTLKRNIKHDWDKEDQYNENPPRPQPRGPRTPPGPPPPDDDEEETLPQTLGPNKVDESERREDYFEPISPDRSSNHQEVQLTDAEEEEEPPEEEKEDEEEDPEVEEEDEDQQTVESIEEEEGDVEEEAREEVDEDDGYEQISSDEDGIADLERENYKLSFDIDYTAEDLASVPTMAYDPYDRDVGPLLYFNPPYRTKYENEVTRLKELDLDNVGAANIDAAVKLKELLELYKDDRGAKWVMALEEVPSLLVKGLSYVQLFESDQDHLKQLVDWTMDALSLRTAVTQPIALNVRQLKAGTKLVSSLAECGSEGVSALSGAGIIDKLFVLLFAEHMSSSLKLNTLKALDSFVSVTEGMEKFLNNKTEEQKSGYQRLVELILTDQTVRVVTAGSAIVQKCHFYEILSDLERIASHLAESTPVPSNISEVDQDVNIGQEKGNKSNEEVDLETPMDLDHLLEASNISEVEVEKIVSILDELLHLLETAPYSMTQPPVKSFPTAARITGPPERDDPVPALLRYLNSCHFLESLTLLLSIPATNGHPSVLQSIKDLIKFLIQIQTGLLFLSTEYEATNLLIRALSQTSDQDQDEGIQSENSNDDALAIWLLYSLQALQYVSELFDYLNRGLAVEETDRADVLGTLHSLYLITFNPIGRNAVSHVLQLDKNLSSLITLMEYYSKELLGDTKSRKSVACNYACMLILLTVQSTHDAQMLEQHSAGLLRLCKADDTNPKLQELGKWLEPLKNLKFEINCIPSLLEYIKQNLDNLTIQMTQEGAGLTTALRVLCHIACPPHPLEGQQKDLKWNLAIIQLFSAEGMDILIRILQKLNSVLILPWRLHANMGTTLQRIIILSITRCTLSLLKAMLTELLRGGSFEFKDVRVPTVLVTLHMVLCSIPLSGRLDDEEQKIQNDIVDILLTFTQGVNEQVAYSEESLANNTWSLMLKEVLSFVLKTPEGFFSGMLLLSELLPFPLPMQTTQPISSEGIAIALNTRKLWSIHLQIQAKFLQEIVRSSFGSTCQTLQQILRRVCIQLCDLASPTALLILRTVLDLIVEDLSSPLEGKERVSTAQTARLLALLDSLASHGACKAALLHLLSGTSKGDERFVEVFQVMLELLQTAVDNVHHQHCAEYVASFVQSLCDQDISLMLTNSTEGPGSDLEQLSNSLPNGELLSQICDSFLQALANSETTYTTVLTCLRTMMFLTEHEYGFFYLKSALRQNNNAIHCLLKRVVHNFNKEMAELASSLLDFLRQIINTDSLGSCGDEGAPMEIDGFQTPRCLALSAAEVKQLLKWKESADDHLLFELDKVVTELCKEDDSFDSLLENVVGLRQMLESTSDVLPVTAQDVEPVLPVSESLPAQFNNRTAYVLADVLDDQLKTLWLSPFQTEEIDTDIDMVKVDLIDLAEKYCCDMDLKAELERSFLSEPSSPAAAKVTGGFKLGKHKHETFITSSGKSEYIEPAKRAHIVPPPRGRGRGGFGSNCRPHDIFRQRKQNTSRPPSMHVDDFVAAECKDVPSSGPPPAKRTNKGPQKAPRGGFSGNRGGRGVFHSQNRFFSPPAPKEDLTFLPGHAVGLLHPSTRNQFHLCGGISSPFYAANSLDEWGNYSRREGGRGSSWSVQNSPRGTYSENRGGQSNFNKGLPSRQPSTGYRQSPRDRTSRGRGAGPSWGGGSSRGKFSGGSSGRGRHVRSFTR